MIELKITGDNASDVMKHLAELTGGFMLTSAERPAALTEQPEPAAEDKPRRGRKPKAEPEVEAAAGQGAGESLDSGASDGDAPITKVEPTSGTTSNTEIPSDDSQPLDFDTDVAPIVLGVVRNKGKPFVVEVLSQFGVERASELKPEQYGELIAALTDAG